MTDAYRENGFPNRRAYLLDLAEEYDAPIDAVLNLADLLGEEEDFDGLVVSLQDAEGSWDLS